MSIPVRRIARFLFFSACLSCAAPAKVQKVETKGYGIAPGESAMVDSVMLKKIAPYKDSVDADMNVELAISSMAMEKGQPESLLGNFVSDVCLDTVRNIYHPDDQHNVDFAFYNNGGLRNSLPRGKITRRDVFELMPFENELVILTLDGATVQKIFNFIASKGGVPVSGLRMRIQNNKPADPMINGAVFDSARQYKVVTSDYLANGGDQCFFLADAVRREATGLKVREALLGYMTVMGQRKQPVSSRLDRRISVSDAK